MNARVLLEVALRVLGFWIVFEGIRTISTALWTMSYLVSQAPPPYIASYLFYSCAALALSLICGFALIFWAPSIAARFYPQEVDAPAPATSIGPGDIYHIATFLLGVYLLVEGIQLGLNTFGQATRQGGITMGIIAAILAPFAQFVSGLLLIFGSRRIANFVSSLAHNPDSVPQQRYSLKVLLIVMGFVAVALGAFRMLEMLAP